MYGEQAVATETAILQSWRVELGLPVYLGKLDMPQGGWTETVDLMEIDLAETIRVIKHYGSSYPDAA